MFKKTCFECGAKVDKVYDSICIKCFRGNFPPIKEVKPINFKICNTSKKIAYKNYFYEAEDLEKILPDIVKKYVIMNEKYKLKDLNIHDFEIDGHKIKFDIEVDAEFED